MTTTSEASVGGNASASTPDLAPPSTPGQTADPTTGRRGTPLITAGDRTAPVTVEARSTLAPSQAFQTIVPIDLSLVFKKWGPVPGVRGVANEDGAWDSVGRSRNPVLTDGSTARERLTEYTSGHSFAYEITGFTGPMRHLVAGVRGEWTFTPDGAGTLIRWTYEFKAARGRFVPLRWGLVPVWRRYMQATVTATARTAERLAG